MGDPAVSGSACAPLHLQQQVANRFLWDHHPPPLDDWPNGDLGQRAAYVLSSLVDDYRYTGDAHAIGHSWMMAEYLLDYCLTPNGRS